MDHPCILVAHKLFGIIAGITINHSRKFLYCHIFSLFIAHFLCYHPPTAKTMDQLLQLPFSEEEEHHLVSFLMESKESHVKELLVLYYLQRARFTEAIRLNAQLRDVYVSTSAGCCPLGFKVFPYPLRLRLCQNLD